MEGADWLSTGPSSSSASSAFSARLTPSAHRGWEALVIMSDARLGTPVKDDNDDSLFSYVAEGLFVIRETITTPFKGTTDLDVANAVPSVHANGSQSDTPFGFLRDVFSTPSKELEENKEQAEANSSSMSSLLFDMFDSQQPRLNIEDGLEEDDGGDDESESSTLFFNSSLFSTLFNSPPSATTEEQEVSPIMSSFLLNVLWDSPRPPLHIEPGDDEEEDEEEATSSDDADNESKRIEASNTAALRIQRVCRKRSQARQRVEREGKEKEAVALLSAFKAVLKRGVEVIAVKRNGKGGGKATVELSPDGDAMVIKRTNKKKRDSFELRDLRSVSQKTTVVISSFDSSPPEEVVVQVEKGVEIAAYLAAGLQLLGREISDEHFTYDTPEVLDLLADLKRFQQSSGEQSQPQVRTPTSVRSKWRKALFLTKKKDPSQQNGTSEH